MVPPGTDRADFGRPQADAITNLPRPEGLGYSVRPFHGHCDVGANRRGP